MLIELQAIELAIRERYVAVIEMRIRTMVGTRIPCWESKFHRVVLHSRWLKWLKRVAAVPALVLYFICFWKGTRHLTAWHYSASILAVPLYVVLPVFTALVASKCRNEIEEQLAELEKELNEG